MGGHVQVGACTDRSRSRRRGPVVVTEGHQPDGLEPIAQIRAVDLEDVGDPLGADIDQGEATFRLDGCGRGWQLEVAVLDGAGRA